MKPLVIYHASCADGFGAAFAAWHKLGESDGIEEGAEYVPMQYGTVPDIEAWHMQYAISQREVYILDFSFPKQTMDYLFSVAKRVVWLDHHATSKFDMACFTEMGANCQRLLDGRLPVAWSHSVIHADDKSGAMLAWEYFHPVKQITNRQDALPYAIHFNGYVDSPDIPATFMEDEDLYTKEAAERKSRRMHFEAIKQGELPAPGQTLIYEARLAPPGYGEDFSEVPMLIKHIDDYDRWQFKIDGTKAFQKALWSYAPWSFEQWQMFFIDRADNETFLEKFINEGQAILRAHDQNVQSVVKGSARECWIKAPEPLNLPGSFLDGITQGWQGLSANCPPHLTSDVGHELATQSGTFGLCWTLSQTDLVAKCSLRSNGDCDVSAIAKAFGGGGHRNAAGFEVQIQTLLRWLK